MRNTRLFDPKNPDHVSVVEAMPMALTLAREQCRARRVRDSAIIKDCEQAAYLALQEGLRGYDGSRDTPYPVYVWKRVYFAVSRYLRRERAARRAGLEAALDAAEECRDTSNPYDDDDEAKAQLKAYLRDVTFRRFLADAREMLQEDPEDTLLRARVWEALGSALGKLDEMEVRFIELRYWDDLSYAKVAMALDVHEKYAQRLGEQLRERLGRDLRERGIHEAPAPEAP